MGGLRRQLFEMDPTCSKHYNPNTPWSESKNSDCKDWNGHASYLDELMAQIPGKDNYDAKIVVEQKSTRSSRGPPRRVDAAWTGAGELVC